MGIWWHMIFGCVWKWGGIPNCSHFFDGGRILTINSNRGVGICPWKMLGATFCTFTIDVGNVQGWKHKQTSAVYVIHCNTLYWGQILTTNQDETIVLQFHCRILTTYSSRNHLAGGLGVCAVSIVGSPSPSGMVTNQHLVGLYWIFRLSTLGYGIHLSYFFGWTSLRFGPWNYMETVHFWQVRSSHSPQEKTPSFPRETADWFQWNSGELVH